VTQPNATARLVESPGFTTVVVAAIAVNAVVLGLQTYEGVVDRWGSILDALNAACLGVFVVELVIRISAYWPPRARTGAGSRAA
jgi:voltage-gated sodium channel